MLPFFSPPIQVSGRGSLGSAKHARVVAAVGSAKAGATVEEALWSNDEPVGRRRRLLSKSPETTQELEKGGVQKVLENDAIFISMNDVNN